MSQDEEGAELEGAFTFDDFLADQQDERREAAFHEAGHLAAAWALDADLRYADIVHRPPFGGVAVYSLGREMGASIGRVVTVMAGPMAQRRHAPRRPDGGERDRHLVNSLLDALCRAPDAAEVLRRHCEAEAARLLTENWDAVEALAAALFEHESMTGDAIAGVLADVLTNRHNAAAPERRKAWAELVARTPTP